MMPRGDAVTSDKIHEKTVGLSTRSMLTIRYPISSPRTLVGRDSRHGH